MDEDDWWKKTEGLMAFRRLVEAQPTDIGREILSSTGKGLEILENDTKGRTWHNEHTRDVKRDLRWAQWIELRAFHSEDHLSNRLEAELASVMENERLRSANQSLESKTKMKKMQDSCDTSKECLLPLNNDKRLLVQIWTAPPGSPKPKFREGQSVIQYWASWFSKAKGPIDQYNKKNRPAWYFADINSYCGWSPGHLYAGMPHAGHVYHAY